MADSQAQIDDSADKAHAEAAGQKAGTGAKPVSVKAGPVAPPANRPSPKTKAATNAGKRKAPARKAAASKTAARKVAAKPASKSPTITQLKDKIMATSKTTDFTRTVKDATADIEARMKAAYDKGAALTAEAAEFQKGNLEAFVESGKLLAAGMQDFGRANLADAKLAAETVTEDVKKVAAVKSPTELLQLQGEIARRNFDSAIAQGSKNAEALMKLAGEVFAPLSSRASISAEKISKAA